MLTRSMVVFALAPQAILAARERRTSLPSPDHAGKASVGNHIPSRGEAVHELVGALSTFAKDGDAEPLQHAVGDVAEALRPQINQMIQSAHSMKPMADMFKQEGPFGDLSRETAVRTGAAVAAGMARSVGLDPGLVSSLKQTVESHAKEIGHLGQQLVQAGEDPVKTLEAAGVPAGTAESVVEISEGFTSGRPESTAKLAEAVVHVASDAKHFFDGLPPEQVQALVAGADMIQNHPDQLQAAAVPLASAAAGMLSPETVQAAVGALGGLVNAPDLQQAATSSLGNILKDPNLQQAAVVAAGGLLKDTAGPLEDMLKDPKLQQAAAGALAGIVGAQR